MSKYYGFDDMIIEISALVISGIVDNLQIIELWDFTIKVMPDAYYKLCILLLKCTIQNFVLWVIKLKFIFTSVRYKYS